MSNKLSEIIEDCITSITRGETLETCLAKYLDVREQLEPLLYTASLLSNIPKASPSQEFIQTSKARLLERLRQESIQVEIARPNREIPLLDDLSMWFDDLKMWWQRLWHAGTRIRRIAIPVALALLLIIGGSLGIPKLLLPPAALASECTLTVLSGNVEVLNSETNRWQQGTDGMTLEVGTRIRTGEDAHAIFTFFEGSTVKLEPGTDVEIQQVEYTEEGSTRIILKQWLGRTWSRVVKMMGSGSNYEIETPSATAVVRGTLFTTEVDETGSTKVKTTEGMVSVIARGEEVFVAPSKQSTVSLGSPPSQAETAYAGGTELLISVSMPAFASVCDPTGSSTGILPESLSFNQIIGSQSLLSSQGIQLIKIPQPMSGDYAIVLRYVADGEARFNIQGKSEGRPVYQYSGMQRGTKDSVWVIRINLNIEDNTLIYKSVSKVELLRGKTPEKILKIQWTKGNSASGGQPGQIGRDKEDEGIVISGTGNNIGNIDYGQGDNKGHSGVNEPGQGNTGGQGNIPGPETGQTQGSGYDNNNGQPQGNAQGQDNGQPQGDAQGQDNRQGPDRGEGPYNRQGKVDEPVNGGEQGPDNAQSQGGGQSQDSGSDHDGGQGNNQSQGSGQGKDSGQSHGDGHGQGRGGEQSRGSEQSQNSGQSQDNGQSHDSGQGQNDGQSQDNGQDQGTGQGQDNEQGQGKGQGQNDGQSQNNGQGRGDGQDQGSGQSHSSKQSQGNSKSEGSGQSHGDGQSQDNGQGQNDGQSQDNGQDQGTGQGLNNGKDQGSGQGQGNGQDQDNGQGQDSGHGKGQGKRDGI